MLTPQEINPTVALTDEAKYERACEEQFDRAIKGSEVSGQWPAIVEKTRGMMSMSAVNTVADKYRAAGWHVVTGGEHRAEIMHPDHMAVRR